VLILILILVLVYEAITNVSRQAGQQPSGIIICIKRLSSVRQEVFTHRHDQTSVRQGSSKGGRGEVVDEEVVAAARYYDYYQQYEYHLVWSDPVETLRTPQLVVNNNIALRTTQIHILLLILIL
jgi:hypothetical protein